MRAIILMIAIVVSPALAAAQDAPSTVVAHFRAYQAAFAEGDFATAEQEAEAALSASEARDGDGGSTAVLALNLATTRLLLRDAAGAIVPAQRALVLAQAGARNVDPIHAGLILGRAELSASGAAGAARISGLLARDDIATAPAAEIYAAASEVGRFYMAQRDFAAAAAAWSKAAEFAAGAPLGRDFAFGSARTTQALAIFLGEIGRSGIIHVDMSVADEIQRLAGDAVGTLAPLAGDEAPNYEVTLAQSALAEAIAVRSALRAKLLSQGRLVPGEQFTGERIVPTASRGGPPLCEYQVESPLRARDYPGEALQRGYIGALVVRLRVADGVIVDRRVVARVSHDSISGVVQDSLEDWSIARDTDSAQPCTDDAIMFVPITFAMQ